MHVRDLVDRGIPTALIERWEAAGMGTLTPCQEEVLSLDSVWAGTNLIVVAPTSAGKTFIGEVLAAHSAYARRRSIVLVPFRALAEQ